MRLRRLIATMIPVLLAALAACGGVPSPAPDPVREEAAMRAGDAQWLAAAQTHGFERALTTAAGAKR
jgi:hypothetical protein